MFDSIVNNEGTWFLSIFVGMFLILLIWEAIFPHRKNKGSTKKVTTSQNETKNQANNRRLNNIAVVIIDTILVRFLVSLLPVVLLYTQLKLFRTIQSSDLVGSLIIVINIRFDHLYSTQIIPCNTYILALTSNASY